MRSIGEFFSKILNKQTQEIFIRNIVQNSFKKTLDIDVTLGAISFKGGTVTVKGLSQTAKSAVYMKKPLILKEIALQSPARAISDIKAY